MKRRRPKSSFIRGGVAFFLFLIGLLLWNAKGFSQQEQGTITGSVTDSSGAIIRGGNGLMSKYRDERRQYDSF